MATIAPYPNTIDLSADVIRALLPDELWTLEDQTTAALSPEARL